MKKIFLSIALLCSSVNGAMSMQYGKLPKKEGIKHLAEMAGIQNEKAKELLATIFAKKRIALEKDLKAYFTQEELTKHRETYMTPHEIKVILDKNTHWHSPEANVFGTSLLKIGLGNVYTEAHLFDASPELQWRDYAR